jgi:hypothetical protein
MDRQCGPDRKKTATEQRTARTAAVTRMARTGCADTAIIAAIAKRRDFANLELP